MSSLHSKGIIWIELTLALSVITYLIFSGQALMSDCLNQVSTLLNTRSKWETAELQLAVCLAAPNHEPLTTETVTPYSNTHCWHIHTNFGPEPIYILHKQSAQ